MSERKPFPIDPEVMARIRPMLHRDISRVVALHKAMGTSVWGRLGTDFLVTLYRGMLAHPDFIGFVYEEPPRVRGMIAGSSNARRLFRDLLRDHARHLVLPAAKGLLADPRLLPPLLTTPLYFRLSRPGDDVEAESMFCSFEPDLRGKRVSGHINKVLFDELLARGQRRVKITTESDNEGAVRQLTSWGFEEVGRFRFYGKEMIVYVLDLETCERVEAVSRHPGPDPRFT